MKIYINCRFLTQRITGVQRFAFELCKALDNLLTDVHDLQIIGLMPNREINAQYADYVFNAAYLYYFPNGLYKNVYLCGYRWAVNESQRKIVRVGLYRWNKVFRKFLLAKNRSLFKQCTTMWLDYAELKLLDRDSSILRKLIMFVGTRVFNFCCLCAKVPLPFG